VDDYETYQVIKTKAGVALLLGNERKCSADFVRKVGYETIFYNNNLAEQPQT
jgi:hypothetical protein